MVGECRGVGANQDGGGARGGAVEAEACNPQLHGVARAGAAHAAAPAAGVVLRHVVGRAGATILFFFFTLVTGPRRFLGP